MNRLNRGCARVLFALCCLAALMGRAAGDPAPGRALLGCWQSEDDPGFRVQFEADRALMAFGGLVQEAHVLDYGAETIRLRCWGRRITWRAVDTGGLLALTTTRGDELLPPHLRLRRLQQPDDELSRQTRPLSLPAAGPVDARRIATIRAQLAKRAIADQEARRPSIMPAEMQRVDRENTRYLKGLVQKIGWIDRERFGSEAATAAFLLVQHSPDLSLMLAVLPHIERAAQKEPRDGEACALLYDRVQVRLGEKQRYGTQLRVSSKGEFQVYPLQDRARVDEFRAAVGLGPLAEYLTKISVGKPVQYLEAD
jgi:hypothetical protein